MYITPGKEVLMLPGSIYTTMNGWSISVQDDQTLTIGFRGIQIMQKVTLTDKPFTVKRNRDQLVLLLRKPDSLTIDDMQA